MAITLTALPFASDALSPHISAKTLEFHYGKHHAGYVEKLNSLIAQTPLENETLENIIVKTASDASQTAIFNNAAQVWNHSFYWQSLKVKGPGQPSGALAERIKKDLGGFEKFVLDFKNAGLAQFGSGWVWLVVKNSALEIMKTANADTPLAKGIKPLLTLDVWEHAYYLDYQNRRADYLEACIKNLLNWDFAASRL